MSAEIYAPDGEAIPIWRRPFTYRQCTRLAHSLAVAVADRKGLCATDEKALAEHFTTQLCDLLPADVRGRAVEGAGWHKGAKVKARAA